MAAPSTSRDSVSEGNAQPPAAYSGGTTQNGPRRWERPWSVQEMHSEARNWSLAGDAGLLEHLREFSQRMISRSHEIGKEVDDLVHEAKLADVRVSNVINDFIMLANSQFVENRVYDEDIEVTQEANTKEEKKLEQEKTREQREAELIPRVSLALKLGIDVIDRAFDKLDTTVIDTDSEDEDNSYTAEPIFEAKDPYVIRPLPFLIGSPQFLQDDSVGLVDEQSEEEPESDQGSISVSEKEEESEESDSEGSSSEETRERKKVIQRKQTAQRRRSSTATDSSEDESNEDIFSVKKSQPKKASGGDDEGTDSGDVSSSEETDDEEEETSGPPLSAGGPKDFASELAARLGTAPPRHRVTRQKSDDEEEEDGWHNRPSEQQRKDTASSDKHSGDSKKEQKGGSAAGRKDHEKHSKIRSKEDDLFGQNDAQDDDDDLFGKSGGLFSSSKGLFDDDDDDDKEGALFGGGGKSAVKTQGTKSIEKTHSVFSDDLENDKVKDEDIKSYPKSEITSTHTVKKPTAQPAIAYGKSLGGKQQARELFGDSGEDDDLFGSASKKIEAAKKESTSIATVAAPIGKKTGLFADDDDDDDDLFGAMATAVTKKSHGNIGLTVEGYDEGDKVEEKKLEDEELRKKVTPEKKLPAGAVSMFGKGPNPLIAALKKQRQTASSDEDEKQDLSEEDKLSQSSSIHSASSTTVSVTTGAGEAAKNVDGTSYRTSSLFANDDEDDLFTSKPKSDGKFASKSAEGNQPNNKLAPVIDKKDKSRPSKGSLFDSSGEEEDFGFFTTSARPTESKGTIKDVSSVSGSSALGAAKTTKENLTSSTTPSQLANKKISSLFDDENEDGAEPLFSKKFPQPASGKETSRSKTQDLFADDDLFSPRQDDNPSVDLFSEQGPLIEKKEKPKDTSATLAKRGTQPSKAAATASLFGGDKDDDNDDDDLFKTKSTPVTSAMKTITGVTLTESMDTVAAGNKSEGKDLRKPAGAVSMFGSIDPTAMLSKKKESNDDKNEKEAKKEEMTAPVEEKISPRTARSKPKPGGDLFGEDDGDDDENLFSPKAAVKAVVEGVTTDESVDTPDMEGATEPKSEPAQTKIPVGAVSMFGSSDPSLFLKNTTITEPGVEKKDGGKEEEKPVLSESTPESGQILKEKQTDGSRSKPSVDLFGNDDEDADDGLFSASKKTAGPPPIVPKSPAVPTKSSASKPPVTTPKPPVTASKPLITASKPLTTAPKPSTSTTKLPSPTTKPSAPTTKPAAPATKPSAPTTKPAAPATKPSAPTTKPAASATKPAALATATKPAAPATATKPAAPATKPPPLAPNETAELEKEINSPELGQTRKLAGAVSMFGGIDPFAGVKKKASEEVKEKAESVPAREDLQPFLDPLSVLTSSATIPTAQTKPLVQPKVKIDKSPASDPVMLLPETSQSGASRSQEQSLSVHFDQPVEAETLTSAGKDRPRQNRRKPQSRKARILAASQTGISFEDAAPASATQPQSSDLPGTSYSNSSEGSTAGPSYRNLPGHSVKSDPRSVDFFGNDDLLEGPPAAISKPPAAEGKRAPSDNDLFGKDLFGGKASRQAADGLFSGLTAGEITTSTVISEITEVKPETDKSTAASKKDDIVDDLYSKLAVKPKTSPETTVYEQADVFSEQREKTEANLSSLLDQDSLFSEPVVKSKISDLGAAFDQDGLFSKPKEISKIHDIFDNDDLFSKPAVKSKTNDVLGSDDLFSKPAVKSKTNDVLDSDDLFSKPAVKSKTNDVLGSDDLFSKPTVKSKTNDVLGSEDLFSKPAVKSKTNDVLDSDDLFSKPAVKSKTNDVLGSDDLFSKPTVKSKTNDVLDSDDLFSVLKEKSKTNDVTFSEGDLFSKPADKRETGNVTGDLDQDGLFSKGKEKPKTNSVAVSNRDDLFSPSAKAGSKHSMAADDDLFSSASMKNSTAKSKTASGIVKGDDLFSDSVSPDSDIFDSRIKPGSAGIITEKAGVIRKSDDSRNIRQKKAVSKEARLLTDTTDIFQDIPEPAPREARKKTPKKVPEKSMFKDDIDDIFADTSAATIKPKKNTKKKVTNVATAGSSDNIFDDPLS